MTIELLNPENYSKGTFDFIAGLKVTHQCIVPKLLMKATSDIQAQTVSEILFGERVAILEALNDWVRIACERDGYTGWVLMEHLCLINHQTSPYYVCVPVSHIYEEASLKSRPLQPVYMTSEIDIMGSEVNSFLPIHGGGWIYAKHVLIAGDLNFDPVNIAEKFIGSAYLWGGRSYEGLDCSALVQLSIFMAGYRVLRDSGLQAQSVGRYLARDEQVRRGDIAFFQGHVGFMLDRDNLLHANATHMAVTIDPVVDVVEWVAEDTDKEPFLGYRRLTA
jgi:hypothetical protein